jgi:hypothetical protein
MDRLELRRWREFLGLTQSDVAKMLSGGEVTYSAPMWWTWRTGETLSSQRRLTASPATSAGNED